jgi:hypothetical protein
MHDFVPITVLRLHYFGTVEMDDIGIAKSLAKVGLDYLGLADAAAAYLPPSAGHA